MRSFFDLSLAEHESLMTLFDWATDAIEAEYLPDGYNIGIDEGSAAGQTVPHHLCVHLIPRYLGDVADPSGGIRCMFPAKARYWD